MEPEMRAAGNYWKLFRLIGGSLTFEILDNAMEAGGLFPPRDALRRPGGDLPWGVPAWMNTRSKAVQFFGSVIERNTDQAAYCYGFYNAMSD
ncbi:hypothetical protein ACJRO7_028130 [Eucalyptus globulus]|uniref:Uncharacterized protein n=1 Tax=Eucalyptus globulus TaxID=34317 RepID=A0ABD3JYH3_EUCGL